MDLRTVNVTRYIMPLREGGSLPALAEADDDFKYVVKFRGAGHGTKALIAELIGGEIARALHFRVPEIVFLQLDEAFGRTEADEEIQDLLQWSRGLNLGLHFLSGALTFDPIVHQVDVQTASQVVWLDALLTNVDRTIKNTNMLTQKCIGYEGTVTTEMDMSSWAEGQRAGLFCIGNLFNGIGVLKENGKNYLYLENNGNVEKVKPVSGKKIYFRATMNARTNQHQLYYSTDNKNFTPCGEAYSLRFGDWKGARVGLYSYNTLRDGGNAFFNWFTYDFN